MPSRGNPNVPTSAKNRARSRKAGLKAGVKARGPRAVGSNPKDPPTKAGSGVNYARTASSKALRRSGRKSHHAVKRKEAMVEEVRMAGEGGVVEMIDVNVVPLSRRQEKLAARKAAAEEANAKSSAARKEEEREKKEKEAEKEAVMDIDIE